MNPDQHVDPSKLPANDDLPGWKQADARLSKRLASCLREDPELRSRRAARRYFDDDDLEYFLSEHLDRGVVQAYTAWAVLDYRPAKTGKTRAERMLAAGIPEAEALLLRARMNAHPTIYRIAAHDPKAGSLDFEDVLLGGKMTVHDRLMSENIEDGLLIAARAFPAGSFHFMELAGPPLGAGMGFEAIEVLRSSGMQFTPDGQRRESHKFGWLWSWIEEWEANWRPPRLCNMDGDELLWHTASFSMADPGAVRQALLERKDIDRDEEEGEFVWSTETGKAAKTMGGSVTLGRIELIGDELVLTCNSTQRFADGRKWIEKLPGVTFRGVTKRSMEEMQKDRPLDERISPPKPVEMTPELAQAMQEMMDKQYMKWVDTPLPILGGQTPRQVCRTPRGREQVAHLIRTIPDPMGPAPVRVPRQAMLRELGLDADRVPATSPALSAARPPLPEEEAFSTVEVGRNDPCPCGSGKRYKKCCGR